jgi:competence protein ComEC
MLLTAGLYVISLYAVLSERLFLFSLILAIISIICIIKNYFPIKYIIIWNLLFIIGIANTSLRLRETDELLNLAPMNAEINGTIVSIPQGINEGKPKFFFKVDNISFDLFNKNLKNEKVLVTINDYNNNDNKLKIHDSYKLKGRLSAPFKASNPSQFDYGNYLKNYNTYAVFYANSFIKIDKKLTLKAKALQKISDFRERILSIHSKYLPSPNLEILGGIVFGDDAVSPPKKIKQSFVNSGLLHILAASGMNVAFIYTFFFWIFSQLRINFKTSVILSMLTVIIYTFMTGLGASIIRASSMLLFVLIGKLIDRDAHSISLLSFVALLMLLYNPLYINETGFQLSFIVTFGILIMSPMFSNTKNKFASFIISTVSIPIIAQLWVIPIQIFYFNNISIYSVCANIMSMPILMILSFGGFTSSLLSGISIIADFICKTFDIILNPLLSILVGISDFWGHLPCSTIQTAHPSIFQILLYYGLLLSVAGLLYKDFRHKYKKTLLISLTILITIWSLTLLPIKPSNIEITTFDVGNADCFLIKTIKNEYIIIDTGKAGYKGGKSQAEIILLKYLKDKGIKTIHSLIITHFDNDHSGGAIDVLKDTKVLNLYVNNNKHNSYSAKLIYDIANKNNTNIIKADNNQIIYDSKGLKITNFLNKNMSNDNENSIITLLEFNKFKMLFTGDASIKSISPIIKSLPKNISVLKVPHHGAIGGLNKEIIDYLNPKYSIISVGENKFGHPSFYILELLKNTTILRTDINNSILIKIDKKSNTKFLTYDLKMKKYIPLLKNK